MTRRGLRDMARAHPHLSGLTRLLCDAFEGEAGFDGDLPGPHRVVSLILFSAQGELQWPPKDPQAPIDLFVLTDHEEFADTYPFQDAAERRLSAASHRGGLTFPQVHLSVHALADANRQLQSGSRLIARVLMDGVVLDERPGATFTLPPELKLAQVASEAAAQNFACRDVSKHFLGRAQAHAPRSRQRAAFLLHQAVEQAYSRVLRVLAFYAPRSHDLSTLRRLAEPLAPQLADVWRASEARPEIFETLQAAYGHHRMSRAWSIDADMLEDLTARAVDLTLAAERACLDAVAALDVLTSAAFGDRGGADVLRA